MAWSETMYTIQHFYNALNLGERVNKIEKKFPFIAKNIDGQPESVDITKQTPGTIWFIKENNNE